MYLLHAEKLSDDDIGWEFTIEGSRGIAYTITMDAEGAHCTCPDRAGRAKTGACKHIIFVSTRVLKMGKASHKMTKSMDGKLTSLLVKRLQVDVDLAGQQNKPLVGESCPICFDDYQEEEECAFCSQCRNGIHKECLVLWLKQKQSCPLCRTKWAVKKEQALGEGEDDALVKLGQDSQ
jgi:hypothetical protein